MTGLKATLILILAGALACAGCIRSHYTLYLLPDDSGKLDVEFEFLETMKDLIAAAPADSFASRSEMSAEDIEIAKKWGIVGITADKSVPARNGFKGTIYFENIHKLRMCDPGNRVCDEPFLEFALERVGDVNRLVIVDQSLAGIVDLVSRRSGGSEDDRELAALLGDISSTFAVTVPGRVRTVEGFDMMKGRRASVSVDRPRIERAIRAGDPSQIPTRLSVTWSVEESPPRREVTAFRKELAEAKANFVAKEK